VSGAPLAHQFQVALEIFVTEEGGNDLTFWAKSPMLNSEETEVFSHG
jgi:hypothetical protein